MLSSKGQANDGNAKQQAKNKMGDGNPDAATNDPDDIGKSQQAAPAGTIINHFSAKGPKHEFCKFKTLQSEWNANDGDA